MMITARSLLCQEEEDTHLVSRLHSFQEWMLTDLVTLEKPKKSSFGGLKRLGTVMSRRKESKQPESMPSPQKRGKPIRNPLRRGSSARDMHQIPSPSASMTELADTSARQAPPSRSGN